jgi:hypothetical protein
MGYNSLDELDRDKSNKSLIPMYLTKYEEFNNKVKQQEEILKNDSSFINSIKQAFINDIVETNKIKEYESKVWITEDKDLTLDKLIDIFDECEISYVEISEIIVQAVALGMGKKELEELEKNE